MTETTTSPGLEPESRVSYTSTKGGKPVAKKKPAASWSSQKPGGMRKMGRESRMPAAPTAERAKGIAIGKKWASHHGPDGAMNAVNHHSGEALWTRHE